MIEPLETSTQSVGHVLTDTDNFIKAASESIQETLRFGTSEDRPGVDSLAIRRRVSALVPKSPSCRVQRLGATGQPERLVLTGTKARTIFALADLLT